MENWNETIWMKISIIDYINYMSIYLPIYLIYNYNI